MIRRSLRAVAAVVAAAAVARGFSACVIADPPASLPTLPEQGPQILRESVVPPVTSILRTWPGTFTIPISAPPGTPVDWEYFVDYDPGSGSFAEAQGGQLDPGDDGDAGVRLLQTMQIAPAGPGCHTIEVMVALNFYSNHTPAGQSDSVTWFYTSNDLSNGCQVYDAGTDAGDGAVQGAGG